jgi:hypothetical protein
MSGIPSTCDECEGQLSFARDGERAGVHQAGVRPEASFLCSPGDGEAVLQEVDALMFVPHRSLFAAQRGERAPLLTGVRANKEFYSFNEQAGRQAVLLHVGLLGLSAAAPFAMAFHRRAGEFEARAADVLCLVDATNSHLSVYAAAPLATPHVLFCPTEVLRPWRFDPREPAVVVIDRNTRVIALIVSADPDDTAEAALVALATCPVERLRSQDPNASRAQRRPSRRDCARDRRAPRLHRR